MHDASIKPRSDISDALQKKHGFKRVGVPLFGSFSKSQINNMALRNTKRLTKQDLVFWQYPNYTNQPAYLEETYISYIHRQQAKVIAILHDIDYLRGWQNTRPQNFNYFDGFISTSKALTQILRSWGIKVPIVEMGPFTYLTQYRSPTYFSKNVYYCGSMYTWKTSFLQKIDFPLYVYGTWDSRISLSSKVHILGSVDSNILEQKLNKGFGLVWDDEINKKANIKPYLYYNWPYKLSLYISCDLPVICQKGTNVGNYVDKYQIGYTVKSLDEINRILAKTNIKDYSKMLRNIAKLRSGVVDGDNIWLAVRKIIPPVVKQTASPIDVKVELRNGIIIIIAE